MVQHYRIHRYLASRWPRYGPRDGVISIYRDRALIANLGQMVRSGASCLAILVCVGSSRICGFLPCSLDTRSPLLCHLATDPLREFERFLLGSYPLFLQRRYTFTEAHHVAHTLLGHPPPIPDVPPRESPARYPRLDGRDANS